MPERERITDSTACALAKRWRVDIDTMNHVWFAAADYEVKTGGRRVWIISGWRSRFEQRDLSRRGRPTAPDEVSTHRSCPSTGVDVSLGISPGDFMKALWGDAALRNGLRWGGGGATDPMTLIPFDWPHVDMGPRRS